MIERDELSGNLRVGLVALIDVDKASAFSDAKINDDEISLAPLNDKYKYVGFFPLFEGGGLCPMCSEDGNKWTVCIGAEREGKMIDLLAIKESLDAIRRAKE